MAKSYDTHPAHDKPVEGCDEWFCTGAYMVTEAAHVTDDIIEFVADLCDTNYPDRVEWEEVFDRWLDGAYLGPDGAPINLGSEYDTPAMRKIQREVRKVRSQG